MRAPVAGLVLATALLPAGCATGGTPSDGEFSARNLLTLEQISAVRATNAYDAVERLKSSWLRPVGRSQMPNAPGVPQFEENPVMVYLDDQRLGGVDQLRGIEIAAVQYIRYYSPSEASSRWGLNHAGGAIYVSTRPLEP